MIRRPPRSTLFPTRRSSDLSATNSSGRCAAKAAEATMVRSTRAVSLSSRAARLTAGPTQVKSRRSEEHTSELQSQSNLVCRLLLEKKKITNVYISKQEVTRD